MKRILVLLFVLSTVFFVDYFVISLLGIVANICNADCSFFENTFALIAYAVVISSLLLLALVYSKKSVV